MAGNAAADGKRLMREASLATLSTLMVGTGAPYGSLAQVAITEKGIPILLLSTLAVHTRNLLADPRASLLYVEPAPPGKSPLEGARLSVAGTVRATTDPAVKARYLERHPDAAMFAGFGDFSFYTLEPSGAHFVAGFGRIVDLTSADLRFDSAA